MSETFPIPSPDELKLVPGEDTLGSYNLIPKQPEKVVTWDIQYGVKPDGSIVRQSIPSDSKYNMVEKPATPSEYAAYLERVS